MRGQYNMCDGKVYSPAVWGVAHNSSPGGKRRVLLGILCRRVGHAGALGHWVGHRHGLRRGVAATTSMPHYKIRLHKYPMICSKELVRSEFKYHHKNINKKYC